MKFNPLRKESLSRYLGVDKRFAKTMTAFDLIAMGVGAVIGTGIFILPGTVAANTAGPGVTLSFLFSAIVCALAAMCYAEFSSALPAHGTYINIIAILIVLLVTAMLSHGMQTSTRINNLAVVIKIAIILLFLATGVFFIKKANYHPFLPYHMTGVFRGATTVFFAYLGFEAVSSSAAEVKNPKRNMPLGIIATVLYMGVSVVLTGMASYKKLDVVNPVSFALQLVHQNWLAGLISVGALIGMFTMMVTMTYSSSRLVYSIGRDGLLPAYLGKLDQNKTPQHAVWTVGIIIALMGGFVSLDQLTNLVNIGTLLAFTFVSFGIIPLRKRKDIGNRGGFKVPFYQVLPIISGLACLEMMCLLSKETYIGAGIWFALGLILYFSYGYRHSKLNKQR